MKKTVYSHAIPIEHGLSPGPLWPWKHTAEELEALEKSDPYNFAAQQGQDPSKKGGNLFKRDWWKYYKVLPDYQWKAIFADTALKDGELNDYTVFQCWAKHANKIYLVDQFRDKVKSIHLEKLFIAFWNRHNTSALQPLRYAGIEDKASGITLIQQIKENGGIPILSIPRNKGESKATRANNFLNWIQSSLVVLPKGAEWLLDYLTEFQNFSPLMTHKFDDQVDCTLDAIQQMLVNSAVENITETKKETETNFGVAPSLKSGKLW